MEKETAKKVNYTPEMVETAVRMYEELGNEGLPEIAEALNRSVKSVRAKLVREQVYVAQGPKRSTAKREGPSKKDMLNTLEALAPSLSVNGLNGATKEVLAELIAHFEQVAEVAFEDAQDSEAFDESEEVAA
jgi:hypothetical protein